MDTLADRYAHFIIHSMLRLEDGEKLTIHAEAADTSGVPVALVYIENGRVESVDEIAPEFAQKDAVGNVMLHLATFTVHPFDRNAEMDAVNLQRHRLLADPIFLDRRIAIPYAVAYVPTASWAEFVYGPSATVDRLYLDLADFLSIEEGNDFTSTRSFGDCGQAVSGPCRLPFDRGGKRLHIHTRKDPGRALQDTQRDGYQEADADKRDDGAGGTTRLGLEDRHQRIQTCWSPTLPCEDIIVPVDFSKAEGHFRSTYPFRFFDSVVEDVEIEVHEGRITAFRSDKNDLVAAYMNIDSMSSCIGEIVLCESLTQAAGFHRSFGIPQLDDESELAHNGLNTGFARLEIPVGGRDLKVVATLCDGTEVTIFEDGLSALDV